MDVNSLFVTVITGCVFLHLCYSVTGQTGDQEVTSVSLTKFTDVKWYLAGNTARFGCSAQGGDPQPRLKWYIDNKPVRNATVRQHYGRYRVEGTLDVTMNREMDKKMLICEANNKVGEPKREYITLNVRYTPYVTVEYDQQKRLVLCSSVGNPDRFTFGGLSRRQGTDIQPISPVYQFNSTWMKKLTADSYDDIGFYKCNVSNKIGTGIGEEFIQPWGAPIILKPVLNYTAYAESNLTIIFKVYSSPPVVKFHWTRDDVSSVTEWDDLTRFSSTNVTMLVRRTAIEIQGQQVTLDLVNVSLAATGNYTLELTTERGRSSQQTFSISVLENAVTFPVTTSGGPVMLEGGLGPGIVVLIVVLIINVIVCFGVIYWRSRRSSQRNTKAKVHGRSREMATFLPVLADRTSADPPTPPKRTTSVGKVRPKVKEQIYQSHYAELDFGPGKSKEGNSVLRKDPPTEYAWIDFKKSSCSPGAS